MLEKILDFVLKIESRKKMQPLKGELLSPQLSSHWGYD
jgi:hypothetical protein